MNFQSQEELCSKLKKIVDILSSHVTSAAKNKIADIIDKLNKYISDMNSFNMEDLTEVVNEIEEEVDAHFQGSSGRTQFREVNYLLI